MTAPDSDNCIKLFKMNDDQDTDQVQNVENIAIIPVTSDQNIFQTIFNPDDDTENIVRAEDRCIFPEDAIDILLKFRMELEDLFYDCGDILGVAAILWEDIAYRISERGFIVTGKQCSIKWEALYSEYLKATQSADESKILSCKYFTTFENVYKLRSKYIDSKILEDVTQYLNSKSEPSPSPTTKDYDMKFENFSSDSNQESINQMLTESIEAVQNILDQNIKESNDNMEEPKSNKVHRSKKKKGIKVENSDYRNKRSKKYVQKFTRDKAQLKVINDGSILAVPSQHNKIDNISDVDNVVKNFVQPATKEEKNDQAFDNLKKSCFYWDSDSTQCLIDFRLYAESNKAKKKSIWKMYKNVNRFVSEKMHLNGYKVSEFDCQQKWIQLCQSYKKNVQNLKKEIEGNKKELSDNKYFWQMDKIFKKSGLETSEGTDDAAEFSWTIESIRTLISIRIPLNKAFVVFKKYVILWQYVASEMANHNFLPTYTECSIKWMELCENYTICVESIRKGNIKEEQIIWDFYQDMRCGFEQNLNSPELVITYTMLYNFMEKYKSMVETQFNENPIQSSATTMSIGDSQNGINSYNLDITDYQDVLKTANSQSSSLKNMITIEQNTTDNTLNKYNTKEQLSSGNNLKIKNLNNKTQLHSPDANEDNWKIGRFSNSCQKTFNCLTSGKAEDSGFNSSVDITDEQKKPTMKWTGDAELLLVKLRLGQELKFINPRFDQLFLWKKIASDMRSAGYNVCHELCRSHWYDLNKINKNFQKSNNVTFSEHEKQIKNTESRLAQNVTEPVKTNTRKNTTCSSWVKSEFFWSSDAIKMLIKLRFSKDIRYEKKYGVAIAAKMQAAGYDTISPSQCTRKWTKLKGTYKKCLRRKKMGHDITWAYFELIDSCVESSINEVELKAECASAPFFWTPNSIKKLIQLKTSLDNSSCETDSESSSIFWKKVEDVMRTEGFNVTPIECRIQWSVLKNMYLKIKNKLERSDKRVDWKYFEYMEKAVNKSAALNHQATSINDQSNKSMEHPIDFSITSNKRKIEEEFENNNMNDAKRKIFKTKEAVKKLEKGTQTIHEPIVMNLSKKIIIPSPTNNSVTDHSSTTNEFGKTNIWVNSQLPNKQTCSQDTEEMKDLNGSFLYQDNCTADKISEAESCINSTNENISYCVGEVQSKTHSDTSLKISCVQKIVARNSPTQNANDYQSESALNRPQASNSLKNNLLVQNESIDSTENIEEGENTVTTSNRWTDAATNLLIHLSVQYNEIFPIDSLIKSAVFWDKITTQMRMMGYNYTAMECIQRWCSLRITYEYKIREIQTNRIIQGWPYFGKIDSIYKKLDTMYHEFKWFLPEKKSYSDKE